MFLTSNSNLQTRFHSSLTVVASGGLLTAKQLLSIHIPLSLLVPLAGCCFGMHFHASIDTRSPMCVHSDIYACAHVLHLLQKKNAVRFSFHCFFVLPLADSCSVWCQTYIRTQLHAFRRKANIDIYACNQMHTQIYADQVSRKIRTL